MCVGYNLSASGFFYITLVVVEMLKSVSGLIYFGVLMTGMRVGGGGQQMLCR